MKDIMESVRRFFAQGGLPLRALLMALFAAVVFFLLPWLAVILAALQLVVVVFNGRANEDLLGFGRSLGAFVHQCYDYLTFNTDDAPFPVGPWPEAKGAASKAPAKKD